MSTGRPSTQQRAWWIEVYLPDQRWHIASGMLTERSAERQAGLYKFDARVCGPGRRCGTTEGANT